ncbi:MAG: hypothetical protein ACREFQ_20975, partial [Stellaceae bacterium]
MSKRPSSGAQSKHRLRRAFDIGLSVVLVGFVLGFMASPVRAAAPALPDKEEYRHELHTYIWGYGLALVLTLVPFGLVYW